MDFEWIIASDEVIDRDHPDHGFWAETYAHEDMPSSGETPAMPVVTAPVDVPSVALAVSRKQAATLLGISEDSFERHVLPMIRVAQVGTRQLVPVRELEEYLSKKSARALKG
jgi:hypothetical protein